MRKILIAAFLIAVLTSTQGFAAEVVVNNADDASKTVTIFNGPKLVNLLHPDLDPLTADMSMALVKMDPGQSIPDHKMENTTEYYYFISGSGKMTVNGREIAVSPGIAVSVPSGAVQSIVNTSSDELTYICVDNPAWSKKNERP